MSGLNSKLSDNQEQLGQLIIEHATELNKSDEIGQEILRQARLNKDFQDQIFNAIKEIRQLQINTISLQS